MEDNKPFYPIRERYTYRVITFGCPVNQGESAALEEAMQNEGFVKSTGATNITIINSCGVTGSAAAEARRAVRKARRESPGALVVLAGCYPQVYHNELAGQLPEVDIIIGAKGRANLPTLIHRRLLDGQCGPRVMVNEHAKGDRFEAMPPVTNCKRTRPVVKIQEGCNEHCTYCIVRQARGRSRSLPAEKVLEQVGTLLEAGHREIILVGNQLGLYGQDLGNWTLTDIIKDVSRLPYSFRLRLGYVEPMNVDKRLLETVAGNPKVCNYLYIPVQSCSDQVLKRMGRRYRLSEFVASVHEARKLSPGIGLWTDLIAGFPGEEETDHAATVDMMRELALSRLHVFPYSPRPGTPAARMTDDVPPDVKKKRAVELQTLGRELSLAYHRSLVGQDLWVLVEKVVSDKDDGTCAVGYAGNHVQVRIRVPTSSTDVNKISNCFIKVQVIEAYPHWVIGNGEGVVI